MKVLFRGKVLNMDEYIVGSYIYNEEDGHMIYTKCEVNHKLYTATSKYRHMQIDEKTLAINFENMIDKNGKKIFASLSEDGRGGDIIKFRLIGNNGFTNCKGIVFVDIDSTISVKYEKYNIDYIPNIIEVIGIHQ